MNYTRKPRVRSKSRARSAFPHRFISGSSREVLEEARARHRADVLKLATAALFGTALVVSSAGVLAQTAQPNSGEAARYAKGRLLVQPRAGLAEKDMDKLFHAHGGRRGRHLKQINVQVVELPDGSDDAAVMRELKRSRHFKFVELDRVVQHAAMTNDPSLSSQWHLPKIQAPTAWDYSAGNGVIIAILDTGVDATHPDLAAAMVPGWNWYDNNSNTADVYGHGTKVAGAAAAIGNNAQGVAGVALQARIMPIRVTDTSGYGYWSSMANGIMWAADRGARVANISFAQTCGSATIQSAAQYMRNKGGVVVIAAGNTGGEITDTPNSDVTCVSATDSNDGRTSWSSWGSAVDVSAPGAGILTTTSGGGYASVSGTSFAAPVTAGVYALMIAANATLTSSALDNILYTTATDRGTAGYDREYGNGRIDAYAAVAKARTTAATDTQAPSVSVSNPSGGSKVSGLVAVDVAAADNVGVTKVDLFVNGALFVSDTIMPFGFSWDTTKLADGQATLMAKAYDAAGNVASSSSVSVTVANDKQPPTVAITNPANGSTVSGTVNVNVNGQDNVQVVKTTLTIDGKLVSTVGGPSLSYSWSTGSTGGKWWKRRSTSGGTSTLTAQAFDPAGNVATTTVTVTKQ
ncbi:MAG: S8 family serine peptidase [Burkholderiales bacterium]|jgi:subtilisin family serine protease|nr:S8 family serine peptidase [Burkholderiales bacterium]